jgi:hypothetical protein
VRESAGPEWERAANSPIAPPRHHHGSRSCSMDLVGVGQDASTKRDKDGEEKVRDKIF